MSSAPSACGYRDERGKDGIPLRRRRLAARMFSAALSRDGDTHRLQAQHEGKVRIAVDTLRQVLAVHVTSQC